MPRYGFIHDKLDIKFLVLYLTARTEAPINFATLTDLAMCDEGVDYFLFTQAVSELVDSEHLLVDGDLYSITEKGRKNGSVCEGSLPFSVRQRCDHNLARLNAKLRQETQVRSEILPRENNGFTVRMILDDNQDNLMTLELYSPTQEQAKRMSETFRACPDQIYRTLLSALSDNPPTKE